MYLGFTYYIANDMKLPFLEVFFPVARRDGEQVLLRKRHSDMMTIPNVSRESVVGLRMRNGHRSLLVLAEIDADDVTVL